MPSPSSRLPFSCSPPLNFISFFSFFIFDSLYSFHSSFVSFTYRGSIITTWPGNLVSSFLPPPFSFLCAHALRTCCGRACVRSDSAAFLAFSLLHSCLAPPSVCANHKNCADSRSNQRSRVCPCSFGLTTLFSHFPSDNCSQLPHVSTSGGDIATLHAAVQ